MSAPRPFENCYWVEEGRLLAGEYPGDNDDDRARAKLDRLIAAGITHCVDLTEEGELRAYESLLHSCAGLCNSGCAVTYARRPIVDEGVTDRETMAALLDEIDAVIREGGRVYVHCWGGVGRTGLVVGCYLARRGGSGEAALEKLDALWRAMSAKKQSKHPAGSPHTDEQRRMVREWREAGPATGSGAARQDRYRGSLLGLAAGDAVGTTVEFDSPGSFPPLTDMVGGGPFHLKPGEWTDDTSMALCLAASLVERGGFDARDQMERYVRWRDEGYMASNGRCFDIGNTVRQSLSHFERSGDPNAGPREANTAGNGSIMRLAPVPLYFAADPAEAVRWCAESSRTTHGAPTAVDACRYFGALILGALAGAPKQQLLAPDYTPAPDLFDGDAGQPLHPAIAAIRAGSFKTKQPPEIRGTGYVVESLEAALWAFYRSESFAEGCLLAANLGDDADTTAAVYGQLAGAYYGEAGIPAAWRAKLARRDLIEELADRLADG